MIPKVAPVAFTPEMELRILGTSIQVPLRKDVSIDVPSSVNSAAAPAMETDSPTRRRKQPTVLMNAKLSVSLHLRLKRTAQFNDISMTDILVRAIEAELAAGRYVVPPDTWGSETV